MATELQAYRYKCNRCAVGQFLIETGRCADPAVGETIWHDGRGFHDIDPAVARAVAAEPYTFGALADRLVPAECFA